jgi:dihydropteroate synthase
MHHIMTEHPHPPRPTERDRSTAAVPRSGVRLSRPAPARCLVMGIVNVTPDSFSDGGLCAAADSAITRGLALVAEGADIVDVGGESTRPQAQRVPVAEELRRVLPVVRALSAAGVLVSVDTMRAEVAAAAVAAGASMVNDVSGGLADPAMAATVAGLGVPFIAMHWRGHSTTMAERAVYDDVVTDVVTELADRLDALIGAGIREDHIVLDPGLGFAKTGAHNWALLAHLDRICELGRPVLVGASRKSFLGALMTDVEAAIPPPADRDDLTCAVSTLAAAAGAYCVRVHNVKSTRGALAVAAAWQGATR